MTGVLLDGAGWLGGIIVAVGYALVVTERIAATGRAFQILNIVGGALLAVTALYRFALPNLIINVVWIGFGAYALIVARRKMNRTNRMALEPAEQRRCGPKRRGGVCAPSTDQAAGDRRDREGQLEVRRCAA